MRITMSEKTEVNPLELISKTLMVAFFAGGVYFMVNSNTTNIETMRQDFKQAFEAQASSNRSLSESIIDLNLSVAKLTNSLEFRDEDVAEIKSQVDDLADRVLILERDN